MTDFGRGPRVGGSRPGMPADQAARTLSRKRITSDLSRSA